LSLGFVAAIEILHDAHDFGRLGVVGHFGLGHFLFCSGFWLWLCLQSEGHDLDSSERMRRNVAEDFIAADVDQVF
jgi:hypothetical protein